MTIVVSRSSPTWFAVRMFCQLQSCGMWLTLRKSCVRAWIDGFVCNWTVSPSMFWSFEVIRDFGIFNGNISHSIWITNCIFYRLISGLGPSPRVLWAEIESLRSESLGIVTNRTTKCRIMDDSTTISRTMTWQGNEYSRINYSEGSLFQNRGNSLFGECFKGSLLQVHNSVKIFFFFLAFILFFGFKVYRPTRIYLQQL